jgi:hypothetical protein
MSTSRPSRKWLNERRRFVTIGLQFCVGLAVVLTLTEVVLARYNARTWGYRLVGREVYFALRKARYVDASVRTLYLGDSVARQLFPNLQSEKGDAGMLSLTTNQAISMAGQFYLLRNAIEAHHGVTDVVLFYSPISWRNNLDQVFTPDYYCGYFHELDQVYDTFQLTHDWRLLAAHSRRALLPNLSAANSWMNIAEPLAVTPAGKATLKPAVPQPVVLSAVSVHYLKRMRQMLSERGIRLHIHSAPASDQFAYVDVDHVYDAPILHLPRALFRADTIHIEDKHLPYVRETLSRQLALPELSRGNAIAPVTNARKF